MPDAELLDVHCTPMPTVTILDADHTIRWIDVHRDYGTRTEPAEIVDALDRLA